MKATKLSRIGLSAICAAASLYAVDASNGKAVIDAKCTACHTGSTDTGLSRISDQRKTPEGWFMTLQRMKRHGLELTDDEQRNVIKYLSDTQGLAPSEIKPYQYALDRTPNAQETNVNEKFAETCVRCHSEARIGLQRRTEQEWNRLVHFHVGQITSLEIQYLSRDRDWFGITTKETAPYLGKLFAKETKEWNKWKQIAPSVSYEGNWSYVGHTPSKGDFNGIMSLSKNSDESYSLVMEGTYLNGETFQSKGTAIVYTGSEYRASLTINGTDYQQTLHFDPTTHIMSGSLYPVDHPELGSTITASHSDRTSLLGMMPRALKIGQISTVTVTGTQLDGAINLSKHLKLNKIISRSPEKVVLEIQVLPHSATDIETIRIAKHTLKVPVYKRIDKIKLSPGYAVARVGGGKLTKQLAVFEATGYAKGKAGLIKLGTLDNVKWSVKNFDEQAVEDKDLDFAGAIDEKSGIFTPAEAGPNMKRKHMTNNAGHLAVTGTYASGKKELTSEAELVVTVQKFINPPIQ